MDTTADRLRKILGLLGPGISAEIDKNVFCDAFGGEMTRETAEMAAERFARANGCSLIREGYTAKFIRAYPRASISE